MVVIVVGITAIDEDGALLDFDDRLGDRPRAIIKNARHTIPAAGSVTSARTVPVRRGHNSRPDVFATDRLPPRSATEVCTQHRVAIELAAGFAAKPGIRPPGRESSFLCPEDWFSRRRCLSGLAAATFRLRFVAFRLRFDEFQDVSRKAKDRSKSFLNEAR